MAYLYVRLYDEKGEKIGQGVVESISNDTLYLIQKGQINAFQAGRLGSIKTKKGLGGNLVVGGITGTALGLGLIAGDDFAGPSVYSGPERLAAVSGGLIVGLLGGIVYNIFKGSQTFIIAGQTQNFNVFTEWAYNR
ncbi:MAG: hypothetical protein ACLFUB_20640 [Cyclobacteriaceae bacterium]